MTRLQRKMTSGVTWSTKHKWISGYCADSVEWCPVEPYHHVLVCGTYQLEQNDNDPTPLEERDQTKLELSQNRLGKIYLFSIKDDTTELAPIQEINTAGVLDQKWCYHKIHNHPVLAVVTSEGFIKLYRLLDNDLRLELWMERSVGDTIALSLDWSSNKEFCEEPTLVVSDSTGTLTCWQIVGDSLKKLGRWKSHTYEAWIAAFNYWNPNVFYSGGDDCLFKSHDVRVPLDALAINRSHEAGVTSIRSHIQVEHQLLTGSYDEKVRVFDCRNLKRCVSASDVNGGVWRLKWHPQNKHVVLAAAMYGGYRLLKIDGKAEIIAEYLEHESIAYGADWRADGSNMVATCSFYDKKMLISQIDLDAL